MGRSPSVEVVAEPPPSAAGCGSAERSFGAAKVTAAKRGTSVSGLVTQELERLADADDRYEDAQRRAERALGRTAPRGGRHWTRDDLHQR